MIGIYDSSVAVGDITPRQPSRLSRRSTATPAGMWSQTDLEPGQGYWVKVSADGTLSWACCPGRTGRRSGGMAPEQGGVYA